MSSTLFGKVDRENIGATGHSQGAFATTSAGADMNIETIAPLQSLSGSRGLHGPVLALSARWTRSSPAAATSRLIKA